MEAQAVDLCTHILHLPQYEASLHHHRTCLSNSDVYLNTHFTISLEIVGNEGEYVNEIVETFLAMVHQNLHERH